MSELVKFQAGVGAVCCYNEWFCGHLHMDKYYFDAENKRGFQYLHWETRILEKVDNKIRVYK